MSNTPRPQDTGCTTIELPNEGVANGVLSRITDFYDAEYDEDADTYVVEDYDGKR